MSQHFQFISLKQITLKPAVDQSSIWQGLRVLVISELEFAKFNTRLSAAFRRRASLHRHALSQVAGLVNITASRHGDVVGEELQGNCREDGI